MRVLFGPFSSSVDLEDTEALLCEAQKIIQAHADPDLLPQGVHRYALRQAGTSTLILSKHQRIRTLGIPLSDFDAVIVEQNISGGIITVCDFDRLVSRKQQPRPEIEGGSFSIVCEFNPPQIDIVGNVHERMRSAIDESIQSRFPEYFSRKPSQGFGRIEHTGRLPVWRFSIPHVYFDDVKQTVVLIAIMDAVDSFKTYRCVPADAFTSIQKTTTKQLADAHHRAVKGPQGMFADMNLLSRDPFKHVCELLFI